MPGETSVVLWGGRKTKRSSPHNGDAEPPSHRRHVIVFDRELHRDLWDAAMKPASGAQLRIKVILQHRGTWMFEVRVWIAANGGSGDDVELVSRGDVLHDAWHVREAHVTQRVGAMAAIIQDEPVLEAERVQEIRAEADSEADGANERAGVRVTGDVTRLEGHGLQEAHVARRRDEDEAVVVQPHHFAGG